MMHFITVQSKAADILPLRHMCSVLHNLLTEYSNALKEEKQTQRNQRLQLRAFSQAFSMTKLGGGEGWTFDSAPHHLLQLRAAPRANLGGFFPCSCSRGDSGEGWTCCTPMQPNPWHRWKKDFAGLPSQGWGGDASGGSFLAPLNHTNSIYLVIWLKHPYNVIPTCEPKEKKLTLPYL